MTWEYKYGYELSDEECNAMGREGWELVSVVTTGENGDWRLHYHFKRPLPPEFYDLVERVSHGTHLELFARERRQGWHSWGNEVESDVSVSGDRAP